MLSIEELVKLTALGSAFFQEEDIGIDSRIGAKDPFGETYNGMQIEFFEKLPFEIGFGSLTE